MAAEQLASVAGSAADKPNTMSQASDTAQHRDQLVKEHISSVYGAVDSLSTAVKQLSALSETHGSTKQRLHAGSCSSSSEDQCVQRKELLNQQEAACETIGAAVKQLEELRASQRRLHASSVSSSTGAGMSSCGSSRGTTNLTVAGPALAPASVVRMPGVLGVLSHLTELLASLKPVTGTAERSLPPHLITYLTSAAMHLYSCLLRSPDAGDPVETAGMMLAGGMLYPAPGSLLPEWAICTARLLLSVNGAASKSWTSDQTSGLRIWQLLYQHKDLLWLALSTAGSAVQQDRNRQPAAGAGWASTRLAQALTPGIQLGGCSALVTVQALLHASATALLFLYGGVVCGRPLLCPTGLYDYRDACVFSYPRLTDGHDPCPATTLLQLEALVEVLLTAALVPMPGTVYNLLLLLVLLVSAAEPEVKGAFLASIHLQTVLRVLQQVVGWDMRLRVRRLNDSEADTAAAAAAAATPPSPPAAAAAVAAAARDTQGDLPLQTCYSTAPQLVLLVLEVLTMEQCPAGGVWLALQHLWDPSLPLGLLRWDPGLQHSPVLWGLLEQCVRAEGAAGKAGMRLAERWVHLAAEELVNSQGAPSRCTRSSSQHNLSTPSASGTSSSQHSAITPPTSGINISQDRPTTSAMASCQLPLSGPRANQKEGRKLSWHAGLGSLVISMAKVGLSRGDTQGTASLSQLLEQMSGGVRQILQHAAQQEKPVLQEEMCRFVRVAPTAVPRAAASQQEQQQGIDGAGGAHNFCQPQRDEVAGPLQQQGRDQALTPQQRMVSDAVGWVLDTWHLHGAVQRALGAVSHSSRAVPSPQQTPSSSGGRGMLVAASGFMHGLGRLPKLFQAAAVWAADRARACCSRMAMQQEHGDLCAARSRQAAASASRDVTASAGSTSHSTSAALRAQALTTAAAATEPAATGPTPPAPPPPPPAAEAAPVVAALKAGHASVPPHNSRCSRAVELQQAFLWCLQPLMWVIQLVQASAAWGWQQLLKPLGRAVGRWLVNHAPTNPPGRKRKLPYEWYDNFLYFFHITACAHISCQNLSGPSEVTLVTNRGGVVCGGCGVVRWCSQECARKGWPTHRKECTKLKAMNLSCQAARPAG